MKHCLSCQQFVTTRCREEEIRRFVRHFVPQRHFPRAFSLVKQLQLCGRCIAQLPLITDPLCERCGRGTIPHNHTIQSGTCADCRNFEEEAFVKNRSIFLYNSWTKSLISRYKYKGDERLTRLFAVLLYLVYCRHYDGLIFTGITYVPLHQQRLEERGFNQAERLAQSLSHHLKLPVLPLLIRAKETAKLSKLPWEVRQRSMVNAFSPVATATPQQRKSLSPSLLLVDDIYTTGSTIRSCVKSITMIPAYTRVQLYSLTIGR